MNARYKLQWADKAGLHFFYSDDINGMTTIAIALRQDSNNRMIEIWDRDDMMNAKRIY